MYKKLYIHYVYKLKGLLLFSDFFRSCLQGNKQFGKKESFIQQIMVENTRVHFIKELNNKNNHIHDVDLFISSYDTSY